MFRPSDLDSTEYGAPHSIVRCEGGKGDTVDVRAALERFNEAPDNGLRLSADALAAMAGSGQVTRMKGIVWHIRAKPPAVDAPPAPQS